MIETGGVAKEGVGHTVGLELAGLGLEGGWKGVGGLRLTSATFPSGGGGPHTLTSSKQTVSAPIGSTG